MQDKDQKDSSDDKGHISESPPPTHIDLTLNEPVRQEPKQESKPTKQDSKPVSDVKPVIAATSSQPVKRQKSTTPPAQPVKPVTVRIMCFIMRIYG